MKFKPTAKLSWTAIGLLTPCWLCANGMRLVSQDGFAAARGEAFVATADNASAVYYNPAGLTQSGPHDLRLGIYGLYLDPAYEPPPGAPNYGRTYHLKNNAAAAPQFFYTHNLESAPLSWGVGLYAPYGASVNWPDDTGFRSVGTKARLTYLRFSPAAAIKLPLGLSLGAGLLLDYADLQLEQGLLRTATPFANNFRFRGDAFSLGCNGGVLWRAHESVSLGVTFRSPTRFTLGGHTQFEQQPIIQPTRLDAEAGFKFPLTVAFGISFRPTPKWNLEVNADYTDWSCLGTILLRQKTPPPFPVQQNIPIALEWRGSWNYCVGATHYLAGGWRVSAGYLFNESSVPDTYYSPLAADLDRHFFSVGTGRTGRRLDFDLTYQLGYGPEHRVTGSTPSSQPGLFTGQTADGTYQFISHAVLLTLGVHF
ncbi:MAG TPA: outer membrane protein transport protein [Verrucomicrobiota bacterium]|nr:outer membrane protein transport protein [Verrucomicrobiota bacterium]HNT15504.1 outer membrane protein transport protein [Verrucomicrobiota bacterium]